MFEKGDEVKFVERSEHRENILTCKPGDVVGIVVDIRDGMVGKMHRVYQPNGLYEVFLPEEIEMSAKGVGAGSVEKHDKELAKRAKASRENFKKTGRLFDK